MKRDATASVPGRDVGRSTGASTISLASVALLAALPLALSACGEDSGSTATESRAGTAQTHAERVRDFGSEAPRRQARQATTAVRGYLAARAAGRWAEACTYLVASLRRTFARLAARAERVEDSTCAGFVEFLATGLSPQLRTADAEVRSVRIDGGSGYAIYVQGRDLEAAMPLSREAGSWRLAAAGGNPLGSPE